jgi:hypothetical protein
MFEFCPPPHFRYLFSMSDNRQGPTVNDSKWYFLFHYSFTCNTPESKSASNSPQFLHLELHKTANHGKQNQDLCFLYAMKGQYLKNIK